jgi:DNA modification methylase
MENFKVNTVQTGNCVEISKAIPSKFVDLTLTSPPYDKLRNYSDQEFSFFPLAEQLFRITKEGGALVWIVGDMLVDGSETGSSFRQALEFIRLGFKLHDTMIYQKQNPIPRRQRRYAQEFEYMFVLVRGELNTFTPITQPCKYAGVKSTGKYYEKPDTKLPFRSSKNEKRISSTKVKGNVWKYWVGNNKKELKALGHTSGIRFEHPAKMPIQLAEDHIKTWSKEGDFVFDPMCGSGTTLVAAKKMSRDYYGSDISQKYVEMSIARLANF